MAWPRTSGRTMLVSVAACATPAVVGRPRTAPSTGRASAPNAAVATPSPPPCSAPTRIAAARAAASSPVWASTFSYVSWYDEVPNSPAAMAGATTCPPGKNAEATIGTVGARPRAPSVRAWPTSPRSGRRSISYWYARPSEPSTNSWPNVGAMPVALRPWPTMRGKSTTAPPAA